MPKSNLELAQAVIEGILRELKLPSDWTREVQDAIDSGAGQTFLVVRSEEGTSLQGPPDRRPNSDETFAQIQRLMMERVDHSASEIRRELAALGAHGLMLLRQIDGGRDDVEAGVMLGLIASGMLQSYQSLSTKTKAATTTNKLKRERMSLLDQLIDQVLPQLTERRSTASKATQILAAFQKQYPGLKVPSLNAAKDRITKKATKTLSVLAERN